MAFQSDRFAFIINHHQPPFYSSYLQKGNSISPFQCFVQLFLRAAGWPLTVEQLAFLPGVIYGDIFFFLVLKGSFSHYIRQFTRGGYGPVFHLNLQFYV